MKVTVCLLFMAPLFLVGCGSPLPPCPTDDAVLGLDLTYVQPTRIEWGMTKAQVRERWGSPLRVATGESTCCPCEVWHYSQIVPATEDTAVWFAANGRLWSVDDE